MIDITKYSTGELSMLVFNIEKLYKIRHNQKQLNDALNLTYKYTKAQYIELQKDLNDDAFYHTSK